MNDREFILDMQARINAHLGRGHTNPPPVEPPPPPPPAIPPGNPGAVLPPLPWPQGQATSDVQHIQMSSGAIFTYQVPDLHAGSAVVFTQGQDTNTQPCVIEFSVSQTPGTIDPNGAAGGYYMKTENVAYNVMQLFRVGERMPLCPQGGVWYINIRWTTKNGAPSTGFSVQWAPGA